MFFSFFKCTTAPRCAYLPHIWRHTFSLFDSAGRPKKGDALLCDLAGPLCFQGDYLAKEVLCLFLVVNVWFNFCRWNFQAQVLPICWPYTTLEPIRWQCTASEFKDISLKWEPGKMIQRFHQGSTRSEQARSMATGKAKMRSWSWFATRGGRPLKSASTSGVLSSLTFSSSRAFAAQRTLKSTQLVRKSKGLIWLLGLWHPAWASVASFMIWSSLWMIPLPTGYLV